MRVRATVMGANGKPAAGLAATWLVPEGGAWVVRGTAPVGPDGTLDLSASNAPFGSYLSLGGTPAAVYPVAYDGKTIDYGALVWAGAAVARQPAERIATATKEAMATAVTSDGKVVSGATPAGTTTTTGTVGTTTVAGTTTAAGTPTAGAAAAAGTTTSRSIGDTLQATATQIEKAKQTSTSLALTAVSVRWTDAETDTGKATVEATWTDTGGGPTAAPVPSGTAPAVPDVGGLGATAATRMLAAAGLRSTVRALFTADPTRHGRVQRQVPAAGAAPTGEAVVLYVARLQGS